LPGLADSAALNSEQLLVKPANLAFSIDEMNFQNPVTLLALLVERIHPQVVLGMNVKAHFVVGDSFVRKLSYQMVRSSSARFIPNS
jgi:hypothetical protein